MYYKKNKKTQIKSNISKKLCYKIYNLCLDLNKYNNKYNDISISNSLSFIKNRNIPLNTLYNKNSFKYNKEINSKSDDMKLYDIVYDKFRLKYKLKDTKFNHIYKNNHNVNNNISIKKINNQNILCKIENKSTDNILYKKNKIKNKSNIINLVLDNQNNIKDFSSKERVNNYIYKKKIFQEEKSKENNNNHYFSPQKKFISEKENKPKNELAISHVEKLNLNFPKTPKQSKKTFFIEEQKPNIINTEIKISSKPYIIQSNNFQINKNAKNKKKKNTNIKIKKSNNSQKIKDIYLDFDLEKLQLEIAKKKLEDYAIYLKKEKNNYPKYNYNNNGIK